MAEPTSTPAATIPSPCLAAAKKLSRAKERSLETSREDHLPKLANTNRTPVVVLLGDSMIERMTTTGLSASLELWPSHTMMTTGQLEDLSCDGKWEPLLKATSRLGGLYKITKDSEHKAFGRLGSVLNAGCGGDKIENILFRLLGDPKLKLPGLLDVLSRRKGNVRLWVVHCGTNNLHKKQGLPDDSINALRVLLTTILQASAPGTSVLLTGLFYRKDIPEELVEQANAKLRALVDEVAQAFPGLLSEVLLLEAEKGKFSDKQRSEDSGLGSYVDEKTQGLVTTTDQVRSSMSHALREERAASGDPAISQGEPNTPEETQLSERAKGKRPEGWISETARVDRLDFVSPSTVQASAQIDDRERMEDLDSEERRDSAISAALSEAGSHGKASPTESTDNTAMSSGLDPTMPQFKPNWWDLIPPARQAAPRIMFLPAPKGIDPDIHLDDHVHLNLEGYRQWMVTLFPAVMAMLIHAD